MPPAHRPGERARKVRETSGDGIGEARKQTWMRAVFDVLAARLGNPEGTRAAYPLSLIPACPHRVGTCGYGDHTEMVCVCGNDAAAQRQRMNRAKPASNRVGVSQVCRIASSIAQGDDVARGRPKTGKPADVRVERRTSPPERVRAAESEHGAWLLPAGLRCEFERRIGRLSYRSIDGHRRRQVRDVKLRLDPKYRAHVVCDCASIAKIPAGVVRPQIPLVVKLPRVGTRKRGGPGRRIEEYLRAGRAQELAATQVRDDRRGRRVPWDRGRWRRERIEDRAISQSRRDRLLQPGRVTAPAPIVKQDRHGVAPGVNLPSASSNSAASR